MFREALFLFKSSRKQKRVLSDSGVAEAHSEV